MLVPQTKPDNIQDFSDIYIDIHQDIYLHIYWNILKMRERDKEQCLLYPLFIPTVMMYLITTWFGSFLCDEQGIQKKILFPCEEKELLNRIQKIQNNEILSEEKKLIKNITVTVQEKRLQHIGTWDSKNLFFIKIHLKPEDYGFSKELLHQLSMKLAKEKMDTQLQEEDLQIIQMVDALDDLIQIANLLSERLERWLLIPTPEEKIQPVHRTFSTVKEEMNHLEQQIEKDMQRLAPNITMLAGSLIGARLISLSGGIERLAMFPASTVQILGAEKALFRFKKEGGKPPKHGVIFQHPLINRAPRDERGKIARMFAAKISIAAKADAFTKRLIAEELRTNLEKRIHEMHEQKTKKKQ